MHARVCAVKSLSSHNHTRETSRLTRESAAASEGTRVSRRALALSSHCLLAPPDGLSSLPLFSAALRPLSLAPLKLIARQSASSLFPRGVREAARGRQQDCCSRTSSSGKSAASQHHRRRKGGRLRLAFPSSPPSNYFFFFLHPLLPPLHAIPIRSQVAHTHTSTCDRHEDLLFK